MWKNKKGEQEMKGEKKHNFLHWIIRGCIGFCLLLVLIGIFYKPIPLTSLSFEKTDIQMDVKDETSLSFTFKPDDASISSIEVICDDGIEGSIDKNTINIKSNDQEGTFSIYLKDHDVSSNAIKVKVVDEEKQKAEAQAKKEAEEKAKKEAEEKAKKEAEEKAKKEAEEQARIEAEAQAQREAEAQTASQAVEQNQNEGYAPSQPIGREVYIAGSGKGSKYHSNPNCSNMKSTITLTVEEAQARGYTPCKKCY